MLLGECGQQERAKLLLVPGARDHDVRQLPLSRKREHALVARAVLPDEPGAVDRDQDGLVVLADVVDRLVERALEKGRVERDDRPHPAHREPGRERHGVLLGDADVDEPIGKRRRERRQARPRGHACGDRDDPRIGPGLGDQLLDEDGGVVRVLRGPHDRRGRRRIVGH